MEYFFLSAIVTLSFNDIAYGSIHNSSI